MIPFAADRAWSDIPGVAWVGVLVGVGLIWAAIRYMATKKK